MKRIGIDLGGTKIEGVVVDEALNVEHKLRLPTPATDGYDAVVQQVGKVVTELEAMHGAPCKVGIGTPGAISQVTGLMKNSNSVALNGKPLKEDLERVLERPIRMANDANCFALSEAVDGAAKGHDVVFGIILGTGVGGGLVINQKVRTGLHAIAGEWGHNVLRDSNVESYCGTFGCVEAYLCGRGMQLTYERQGGSRETPVPVIVESWRAGDSIALATRDEFLDNFGKALSVLVNIIDPDAFVLGGGLSNIEEIYALGPAQVEKYVFNDEFRTPILKNLFGDSSGVRGAAALWSTSELS